MFFIEIIFIEKLIVLLLMKKEMDVILKYFFFLRALKGWDLGVCFLFLLFEKCRIIFKKKNYRKIIIFLGMWFFFVCVLY